MKADFKFNVRAIENNDLPFLKEMLYQAIYIKEGLEPPSRSIVDEPNLKKYISDFGKSSDYGYIAIDDKNTPLGAIWLRLFSKDNKGWGFIDETIPELSIAVDKNYRGIGIGTKLMDYLLKMTVEKYKSISLSVDSENPAIHLYERFGFIRCGEAGTSLIMRLDRD